ncbi:MAG: hypothetical protein EZS28_012839 [Streblomastix strix]|uniref:Uncharacterized protein n=1 Tax=Streblomastix strix TaxID=222440 RepID=A0A5J4WBA2_9EUKA|nr:MAG: hypothetical protein EZS28_012839 [Streblomastix strix]
MLRQFCQFVHNAWCEYNGKMEEYRWSNVFRTVKDVDNQILDFWYQPLALRAFLLQNCENLQAQDDSIKLRYNPTYILFVLYVLLAVNDFNIELTDVVLPSYEVARDGYLVILQNYIDEKQDVINQPQLLNKFKP